MKNSTPGSSYNQYFKQMQDLFTDSFKWSENFMLYVTEGSKVLVIENKKGRIIGLAIFDIYETLPRNKQLHLNNLCVDKNVRNKGYGTLLLQEVEKFAKAEGCNNIVIASLKNQEGVYYKNNYLINDEYCLTGGVTDFEKPVNETIYKEAQICYEIFNVMSTFKLKNVKEYVNLIVEKQEFDNMYQYGLNQDEINDILSNDKNMPVLLDLMQDLINYNLQPRHAGYFIDEILENNNNYKNSELLKHVNTKKNLDKNNINFDYEEKVFKIVGLLEKDNKTSKQLALENEKAKG